MIQDEKELISRITRGDEAAFAEMFNRHWNNIYSAAFVLIKSEALAEDALQEIFLKVWERRSELINIERFDNYLFILTRNHPAGKSY